MNNSTGLFPCPIINDFSTCNFSNWDTMIFGLIGGILIALLFFIFQHQIGKQFHEIWKDRFNYMKSSILFFLDKVERRIDSIDSINNSYLIGNKDKSTTHHEISKIYGELVETVLPDFKIEMIRNGDVFPSKVLPFLNENIQFIEELEELLDQSSLLNEKIKKIKTLHRTIRTELNK